MANTFPNLLTGQTAIMKSIRRVAPNLKKKLAKGNFTAFKTKSRMESLAKTLDCLRLNVLILQAAMNEDEAKLPYFPKEAFLNAEEDYLRAMDYLSETHGTLTQRIADPSQVRNISYLNETLVSHTIPMRRIELTKFDGNYTKWKTYRDNF